MHPYVPSFKFELTLIFKMLGYLKLLLPWEFIVTLYLDMFQNIKILILETIHIKSRLQLFKINLNFYQNLLVGLKLPKILWNPFNSLDNASG